MAIPQNKIISRVCDECAMCVWCYVSFLIFRTFVYPYYTYLYICPHVLYVYLPSLSSRSLLLSDSFSVTIVHCVVFQRRRRETATDFSQACKTSKRIAERGLDPKSRKSEHTHKKPQNKNEYNCSFLPFTGSSQRPSNAMVAPRPLLGLYIQIISFYCCSPWLL